jgi:hypothetical protein
MRSNQISEEINEEKSGKISQEVSEGMSESKKVLKIIKETCEEHQRNKCKKVLKIIQEKMNENHFNDCINSDAPADPSLNKSHVNNLETGKEIDSELSLDLMQYKKRKLSPKQISERRKKALNGDDEQLESNSLSKKKVLHFVDKVLSPKEQPPESLALIEALQQVGEELNLVKSSHLALKKLIKLRSSSAQAKNKVEPSFAQSTNNVVPSCAQATNIVEPPSNVPNKVELSPPASNKAKPSARIKTLDKAKSSFEAQAPSNDELSQFDQAKTSVDSSFVSQAS